MKKILISLLLVFSIFLTGCGKNEEEEIRKKLFKNIEKIKNYYLEAEMEIINNDDSYQYDVEVSYAKGDYYKVRLQNRSNGYEQTILKNKDGVFVVTPALNKSFKFQSEWPYNNSQAYLLHSLKKDIEDAKDLVIEKNDDKYYFKTSNINYPNNQKLVSQKIVVNSDGNIEEVYVLDKNDMPLITVKINKMDTNAMFDDNYFKIEENSEKKEDNGDASSQVTSIDDAIFPLYLPTGTTLSEQEKVNKDDGERIIMTFSGEKPFLLVEETASIYDEFTIIPTSGEPYMLIDTVGSLTNESIAWTSGGIDYYIVSDVMTQHELIEVARSISTLPVMK